MVLPAESNSNSPDKPNRFYVLSSNKIEDLSSLIVKKPGEEHVGVLIVPDKGDQIRINFRLPKHEHGTVADFLPPLRVVLKENEEISSIYLIPETPHGVRYVVTVQHKSRCDKDDNKTDTNATSEESFNRLGKTKTSKLSYSCVRRSASEVELKSMIDPTCVLLDFKRSTQKMFIYPASPCKGRINIMIEDFNCLNRACYINDIIIDFYLKYLVQEKLVLKDRCRVHVFSSYFYTRLTRVKWNALDNIPLEKAQHNAVKNWTRNVNLFEKDFIVIPVNQNKHWFLAIICFPGRIKNEENMDKETHKLDKPFILIFDSLRIGRSVLTYELKDYLKCEYIARMGHDKVFEKNINAMKVCHPKVPQQFNSFDCGLYLLQFAESFFKDFLDVDSIEPFLEPLDNWFGTEIIKGKRYELKNLLLQLAMAYKRRKNQVS